MNVGKDMLTADKDRHRLKKWIVGRLVIWTVIIVSAIAWLSKNIDQEILNLAQNEAISIFSKDQAFRTWANGHGGVYVPITEKTQPNPYLSHIPERDITTASGRKLTLLNSAYMLREMMSHYDDLYGAKGRVVSLFPLNPSNMPDKWEEAALSYFSEGGEEVSEISDIEGKPYIRLLRAMNFTPECMKCHDHPDYDSNKIIGAVGVSVPLGAYLGVSDRRKRVMFVVVALLWLLGVGVILLGGKRGLQRIDERQDYEQHIWRQANYDWLTRLPNRNLFQERLERGLTAMRRENRKLALVYIDLDRFKDVNDTLGHHAGDLLLKEAADRLSDCVRAVDTVSRLGGDEFAVILTSLPDNLAVQRSAYKILETLRQPFEIDQKLVHVSASIGITFYPKDGKDSETLLKNADTAMYQAKAMGRNTYRFYTQEMNQEARQRVDLENALRSALKEDDFVLHYQPIVELKSGALIGAEALIRWNDSEYGDIAPDKFIPVAETVGLIYPIGDWVLNQAIADFQNWSSKGLVLSKLAVNVSSLQFKSAEFHSTLIRRLQMFPELSQRLCLEITESLFLDDEGDVNDQMAALRNRGVSLSIDDFGTGYSSLGYLKRFPVDCIKIDRAFVRDIITDPEDAALCEAIIAMAHHLNLNVIAEGVEDEDQLSFLKRWGCDSGQGYLFSEPLPAEEFFQEVKGSLCG